LIDDLLACECWPVGSMYEFLAPGPLLVRSELFEFLIVCELLVLCALLEFLIVETGFLIAAALACELFLVYGPLLACGELVTVRPLVALGPTLLCGDRPVLGTLLPVLPCWPWASRFADTSRGAAAAPANNMPRNLRRSGSTLASTSFIFAANSCSLINTSREIGGKIHRITVAQIVYCASRR